MDYKKRWLEIRYINGGGQGKVYQVRDTDKLDMENKIFPIVKKAVIRLIKMPSGTNTEKNNFKIFCKAIVDISKMDDPINYGALKVLHEPKDARNHKLAEKRIKKEIEAMSDISHPNLLKILDHDKDAKWYVSEYHPKGTLNDNKNMFTGNFVDALKALRPLVEGVAKLHEKGFVHRDIKPHNVFLDLNGNLVLGDFGLVFFSDAQHTRISGTWENVGSRDWMPPWATAMRIEDVKPTFDVFALGKLLWAMVANKPVLPYWYFNRPDKPQFNLEKIFPKSASIKLINPLLQACVVENEKDCLEDAKQLLREVDKILSIIEKNIEPLEKGVARLCRICGIGYYNLIVNNQASVKNFGLDPAGMRSFICTHCGHVDLFYMKDHENSSPVLEGV